MGGVSFGKNMIKCPFHSDKTPSMHISAGKNMFHCFGCGAAGDPIKFVEKMENIPFLDACKKMADWYGIEIATAKRIVNPYDHIISWAENNLFAQPKVLEYLEKRGLTIETIRAFRLGWINQNWREFLHEKDIQEEAIGMNMSIINMFENRIIFPIIQKGKCVGMGARSMGNALPKYINTVFEKSKFLFGHDQVKNNKKLILVEGYLDAMMCYQYGFSAVASLGTNISMEQLSQCFDLSKSLTVLMDGDVAGINASSRIAEKMLPLIKPGYVVEFVYLPLAEDPASYLTAYKALPSGKVSLLDKLWEDVKPLSQEAKEMQVEAYHGLLKSLELIKDPDLRRLYTIEIKNKWFNKTKINELKFIKPPQKVRQMLLLSTIVHFPAIFDDVADYVMAMELKDNLYDFREYMVCYYPQAIDKIPEVGVSSFCMYSFDTIYKIAPFLIDNNKRLEAWFELFSLYFQEEVQI